MCTNEVYNKERGTVWQGFFAHVINIGVQCRKTVKITSYRIISLHCLTQQS